MRGEERRRAGGRHVRRVRGVAAQRVQLVRRVSRANLDGPMRFDDEGGGRPRRT